ncbi:MAG: hypothetical protein AB7I68_05190 [Porticoccaceae bacterium]
MTTETETAICREILSRALVLMADEGVTDTTGAREIMRVAVNLAIAEPTAVDSSAVIRLALALVGAHRGGPLGIAAWAEALAASIRNDPSAPPPTTLN